MYVVSTEMCRRWSGKNVYLANEYEYRAKHRRKLIRISLKHAK